MGRLTPPTNTSNLSKSSVTLLFMAAQDRGECKRFCMSARQEIEKARTSKHAGFFYCRIRRPTSLTYGATGNGASTGAASVAGAAITAPALQPVQPTGSQQVGAQALQPQQDFFLKRSFSEPRTSSFGLQQGSQQVGSQVSQTGSQASQATSSQHAGAQALQPQPRPSFGSLIFGSLTFGSLRSGLLQQGSQHGSQQAGSQATSSQQAGSQATCSQGSGQQASTASHVPQGAHGSQQRLHGNRDFRPENRSQDFPHGTQVSHGSQTAGSPHVVQPPPKSWACDCEHSASVRASANSITFDFITNALLHMTAGLERLSMGDKSLWPGAHGIKPLGSIGTGHRDDGTNVLRSSPTRTTRHTHFTAEGRSGVLLLVGSPMG